MTRRSRAVGAAGQEIWLGEPRPSRSPEASQAFALCYPNTYWVGMSSLGFQIIYESCLGHRDWTCERFFMPPRQGRRGAAMVSVESGAPMAGFDAVGFSVSFEGDYVNLVKMLAAGGIPPVRSARSSSDPVVLAGGPAVTMNPLPLSDFIDAFVIGDGDETIHEILDALSAQTSKSRPEMIEGLSQIDGVWVPDQSEWSPSVRRIVTDLDDPERPLSSCILADRTEFPRMVMAEVARGCKRACRFCLARQITSPVRLRKMDSILDSVMRRVEAAERSGVDRRKISVGLVAPAVSDHPDAASLCRELVGRALRVSTSSLRLESLTPDLARALREGGQRTLTLAPEAGTERLRNKIGKPASDDVILSSLGVARAAGFAKLKLYFMFGLPGETDDDIDAISSLCREAQRRHGFKRLGISAAPFVPKPCTPFAREAMRSEPELKASARRLERGLRAIAGVSVGFESPRTAQIEHRLAHAGPEAGTALGRAALHSEPLGRALAAVEARGCAKGTSQAREGTHRRPRRRGIG